MLLNSAHTKLVAEVADRKIINSSVLTFFEKHIILCFNIGCVYANGIVVITVFVSAGSFV